jgi:hypothetical protein
MASMVRIHKVEIRILENTRLCPFILSSSPILFTGMLLQKSHYEGIEGVQGIDFTGGEINW